MTFRCESKKEYGPQGKCQLWSLRSLDEVLLFPDLGNMRVEEQVAGWVTEAGLDTWSRQGFWE